MTDAESTEQGRAPAIFWYNVAYRSEMWWAFLRERGLIAAGYQNRPGDDGELTLRGFVVGDRIIAYVTGVGAVGWGRVDVPGTYRLVPENDWDDVWPDHEMRHRLKVTWCATAHLWDAVPAHEIRAEFGIHHPLRTSQRITDEAAAERLIQCLSERFESGNGVSRTRAG